MSLTLAALAAVTDLAKEHPGLSPVEAAAYALGFVEGKECEDARTPEANEDFYAHLNKEWLEDPANAIPGEYSSWGGFTKLHDDGLKTQIQMVKDLKNKADKNEEETKISAIWEASASLLDAWTRGEGTYNACAEEFTNLDSLLGSGGSETTEAEHIERVANFLYYSQTSGFGNVFDFDKGSDLTNSNNVVLDFSTCGLSLPSREYYTEEKFKEKRDMYEQHLKNVAVLINDSDAPFNLDADFVENVLAFEHQLAKTKMKNAQNREYDQYYTNTTLDDLYKKANELRSLAAKEENYDEADRNFELSGAQLAATGTFLETMYSLFNFREVLEGNHKKFFADDPKGPNVHQITAFDGDSIRRVLAMVLDPAIHKTYRAFLQYKIIRRLQSVCTKALDEEFFDFYSRKLSGQEVQKPDDKRSIGRVNQYAGEMMGKVFVATMFPPESKGEVSRMIQETTDVMKSSITNSDWLTKETQEKALVKLDKFRVKIGYPDVWKDYSDFDVKEGDSLYVISKKAVAWALRVEFFEKLNSVLDRNEWHMTPQTVNAYFSPTQNEIVFPAAILQPPFYHQSSDTVDFAHGDEDKIAAGDATFDLAAAANFGGIIAVIAHEITHGYDDQGRKFDGEGNLNDWWTEADGELFKTKTDIMINQAKGYVYVDNEDGGKIYNMDPKLTMGENLADLGGLSLALGVLKNRLAANNASDGAIKASMRALFKSWATIWKLNIKKDSRIQRLTTDPHAPCEFRANLVNNMDEFYEVFGVKEGDAMYIPPAQRLRMW